MSYQQHENRSQIRATSRSPVKGIRAAEDLNTKEPGQQA
jgi:hypothetical protein